MNPAEAIGPIPNNTGTEKRRGVLVGEDRRQWVGEVLPNHTKLGVASIHVIASELRTLAEVFRVALAVGARTIGRVEPWDADAVAYFTGTHIQAHEVDHPYDLMAGNNWEFWERQIAFDRMEVGVAKAARVDADTNLVCRWNRVR